MTKCSKNWDLKREGFKSDTSKRGSSILLETEITFSQNSQGLPEKIYNRKKMNRVRLHDPVEILKEAEKILDPQADKNCRPRTLKFLFSQRHCYFQYLLAATKRQKEFPEFPFSQDLIYSVSFGKKGYQNMSNSASQ